MCGLAGFCPVHNLQRDAERLRRMVARLHHRGPDETGSHVDEDVALGHARLSIIDVAGGRQPMANEDGHIRVVFNGEIFNYVELRDELRAAGHRFATASDTEVIVHAYEQWGDDFPRRLNGQFAIALWDARHQRLLLVRDRPGIHPLFYTERDGRLYFASEVKGLLPAFDQPPALDLVALDQIMTFWAPLGDRTVFDGVQSLPPGEMLVREKGRSVRRAWWQWAFAEPGDYLSGREADLAAELRHRLGEATRIRLRADVPVGAYLSGGLDSSVLTALMHRQGADLRTFSIGFEEKALDEGDYQRMMIDHLGARHSFLHLDNADVGDAFPRAIWHGEQPILRTAPVPMMLLSGLVRDNGYKVVLTGEGSDEVLGGYDIFKEGKIRQFWARNADSAWRPRLLQRLYPYLDLSQRQGQAYLKAFFGIGLDQAAQPWFAHIPRMTTTAHAKTFLAPDVRARLQTDALAALEASLPASIGRWDPFNRAQYVEARSLMAGYLLSSQGDRMLMANSVEGRFPFLDHTVIEFANRLDPRLKMKVLNEKYLLKQAMRDYLPAPIVARYKQPYRAPDVPAFFGRHTPDYVEAMFDEATLRDYGYFEPARARRLLEKARRGRVTGYKDNMAFIGILSTQLWHYHFVAQFNEHFGSQQHTNRKQNDERGSTGEKLHLGEFSLHG